MHWARITVTTTDQASEAVANFLFEIDAFGVELIDTDDSTTNLIAYFPLDDRVNSRVQKIRTFLSKLPFWGIQAQPAIIDLKRVEAEEWTEAWKSTFSPQHIGKRLLVTPTWYDIPPDEETIVIRLDPGMAFGTGYHPTTRLTLEMLEKTIKPNQLVADIGTGSGILAIAAVKLGAKRVDTTELDNTAIPVAQTNLEINDVAEQITLCQGDGLKPLSEKYDVIVGNILTKVVLTIVPDCQSRLLPEGHVIFSGILETELDVVQQSLTEHGFHIVEVIREADEGVVWVAILARVLS